MNGCFWCRAGTGPGCRGHGRNTIFLIIIKPTIELSLTKGGSAIISPNYEVVLVIFPHLFNPLKKMQLSRKIGDKKKKKSILEKSKISDCVCFKFDQLDHSIDHTGNGSLFASSQKNDWSWKKKEKMLRKVKCLY